MVECLFVHEANHDYWDRTRLPKIQRIIFDHGLSHEAALERLKTTEGGVDLVTDIRPLETLRVAQSPFGTVRKECEYIRAMHGMFNTRKAESPWRDVRLRQAVNYAINRADFMRYAVKGNGVLVPALLPVHPEFTDLRATVGRHRALAKGYATTAVRLIDTLRVRQAEQEREREQGDAT